MMAATAMTLASCSSDVNLKGKVTAQGKPLADVLVSDGLQIVKTDSRGRYEMNSQKKDSVVYVITPSGYEAFSEPGDLQTSFWHRLTGDPQVKETFDFTLTPVDQSNYTTVVMTDAHFIRDPRRKDLDRFEEVMFPVFNKVIDSASKKGPVYMINLGDFTHELFWEEMDFGAKDGYDFLDSFDLPAKVFSVTGNHDNDGGIIGENTDTRAAYLYRSHWGPLNYSVNIGGDHWIFMDDIIYVNTPGKGKKAPGVRGARDYYCDFTEDQLEWLKADLLHVSPDTDVYLCVHIPLFYGSKADGLLMKEERLAVVDEVFSKFEEVTIFSGHVHRTAFEKREKFPRFTQYSFNATSGNMWECSLDEPLMSADGTDAGVPYIEFSQDAPHKVRFESVRYGERYMSIYDMNEIADLYRKSPKMKKLLETYPKRPDYTSRSYRNKIHVNYWMYMTGETVEIYEDGKALEVTKVNDEDPWYNFSYFIPYADREPGYKSSHATNRNMHMFSAQARKANSDILVVIKDAAGNEIRRSELKR